MVSFSCESCGDVLTKPKLDKHRNQCRYASFTCLDCQTHFQGNEYKSHSSCISEAQKYEKALYKEKPSKKKSVTIAESAIVPRKAYVEDAPDQDLRGTITIVDPPPAAPSPPSAVPSMPVNVFDFLVNDETPNASRTSLPASKEQMKMVEHAQPLFKSKDQSQSSNEAVIDTQSTTHSYDNNGYTYGDHAIVTIEPRSYQTPAPKERRSLNANGTTTKSAKSTDKKRKRQIEELDLTQARRSSQELDEEMLDAADPANPPLLHTGLTGGLNRLLSKTTTFPPSPEYSNPEPSPLSPQKRSKSIVSEKNLLAGGAGAMPAGIIRGRGNAAGTGTSANGAVERTANGQLVRVRKVRRASDESRPRKHHRSQKHGDENPSSLHNRGRSDRHDSGERDGSEKPRRALKTIEYHYPADGNGNHSNQSTALTKPSASRHRTVSAASQSADDDSQNNSAAHLHHQQMVVYRTRAELFLSFVTKGPESESGCSINKALKRYHRERMELGLGGGKVDEEKELWKSLRLRKNDRGEIVLIL